MTNLVFMPISLLRGMAGTKRLQNYLPSLFDSNKFSINNIILSKKQSDLKESLEGLSNIYHVNQNGLRLFIAWIKITRILKNLLRKNEENIIYYYGYPDITNIFYLYKAKKLGYKIVFDIVENIFIIKNFNSLKVRIKVLSSSLILKHINCLVDGLICISSQIQYLLKKNIGNTIPLILIPITIKSSDYYNSTVHNELGVKKMFYGGSFGEKDGLSYFLEAFDQAAELFNIELILTGQGNRKDTLKIAKKIATLKNKNKIKILGYLEQNEYYKILCSCHLHCVSRISSPYANNGFPFKLGEMLATSNPVITTKVGDVMNYIRDNEAVIIEPDSTNEIFKAISFLLNSPDEAAKIGEAGKLCAYKHFDSKIHTNRLIKFIEDLK